MSKFRQSIFILFLTAFLPVSAMAQMMCHQLIDQLQNDVTISKKESTETPSELNLAAKSFDAVEPAQVSAQVKELVLMLAQSRSMIISDKEINQKGRLLLGMPVGNGFTLELKYKSNSGSEPKYVLDHINLISPSGKQLDVSANPIDPYFDTKLSSERVNFEIGTYPDGFNINATIPTVIKGKVLKEIQELAPKLELVPKEVVRELATESELKVLKTKANRAYMKYFIKRYSVRGVFKTLFKLVVYEPLKLVLTLGVIYTAANTFSNGKLSITEAFGPKAASNIEWVSKSLHESAAAEQVPAEVRSQISQLEGDLRAKSGSASEAPGTPLDQNASKMQLTKDQYLWTTTLTDKATGRTSTIIFVSSDNKQGTVNYTAIVVDPVKYKKLIEYIKSVGQFIPVSPEDLK
ncbi:MAG: hypothetical protein K0R29_808 [Pseudobdellovibrio sp.]|jgi:hypothetical protein|nr:hypothetical protein [Pseudobdellovibrio sp.]